MNVFTPPNTPDGPSVDTVFLAGSIEMDKAMRWQDAVCTSLAGYEGIIFNPRRDDWDSSWGPDSPELAEQIDWEIYHLGEAEIIFFYFQGDTLSPVSLLELGMACQMQEQPFFIPEVIVVCDKSFWRRTNILRTCERFGVPVYDDLQTGIAALHKAVKDL